MSEQEFTQPICGQIWNQKYRFKTDRKSFKSDESVEDTWNRIASACADQPRLHNDEESRQALQQRFYNALDGFKFLPAGRITAGAGTGRNVTLFNCYVMGTIPDSLTGIFDMLKEAAITMQQGGGIGYDFSTLRPKGALVQKVESDASGPLSFMDVWDAMCKTIMSAGNRRGAMMATMRCDHPDIIDFITAKKDKTRLRNFNVSVLVTDAFMECVKDDHMWELTWNGEVWSEIPARELWELILENTFNYAEPGVIFIDRINKENNLHFLETIAATNPCGEQPLPPYGACLLGSVNLARMVKDPFNGNATINYDELENAVKTGVRLLDSVVDISLFPLEQQKKEALYKRRQGLGVTGLADLLFMMGYRYGSIDACGLTDKLMKKIAVMAYEESIQMAREMGPCPALETKEAREAFCQSGFMQRMPQHIHDGVMEVGIRNTHLLSVAPTGTISMYAGNVSSGIEPIFAYSYNRVVTRENGEKETEVVSVYSVHLYLNQYGGEVGDDWWNSCMVTAQDLLPDDHIRMQAVAQKWIDSSISKTVNCPEDISFEDFKEVYMTAYETGCKGCTTYRPNEVTGSVLSVVEEPKQETPVEEIIEDVSTEIMARPDIVQGYTYKLRWNGDAVYVTFNHALHLGRYIPFEMFVVSQSVEHQAWTSALTRMISAVFRRGGDVKFVSEELMNVYDPKGGQFVEGRYLPSMAALLGQTLNKYMEQIGYLPTPEANHEEPETINLTQTQLPGQMPDQCPSCKGFNMVKASGCLTCIDCGHSKCG